MGEQILNNISSVRLTVPKALSGEINRRNLIDRILDSDRKIVYVHAGAGFGKTTLLSQIARCSQSAVWFSLSGENDIFTFIHTLSAAIRQSFPGYQFAASEYLPFIDKDNFTTMLTNAMISSIEKLSLHFILILDDLHSVREPRIMDFIACFMRFAPVNIRLCLGSREAPWPQLTPLTLRGAVLEIKQSDLIFTKEEAAGLLGFENGEIYAVTEGWPLALRSFRVLLENGVSLLEVPSQGKDTLYAYLFYECMSRLPAEMADFLHASACFEELDADMLNAVLSIKNAALILESLTVRNLFTIKTGSGHYRYQALFRQYLLGSGDTARYLSLRRKTANYYYETGEYSKAFYYAMFLDCKDLLEKIILKNYREMISAGRFSELRQWFLALSDDLTDSGYDILIAKGAYLSCIGNFTQAQTYLDRGLSLLDAGPGDNRLYLYAMIQKARVLRNSASFEESNALLDGLIRKLDPYDFETVYAVMAEKLYNLCWNSQADEAYALARKMVEACARAGNLKVRAWFERYLCVVHFFAGRMKETIYYYEKSLQLPLDEQDYLSMHDIGIYAAKAYQMTGDSEHSMSALNQALAEMRNRGKYEEMWSGYLFAVEIHFQNTLIERANGKNISFATAIKYFMLADEYALLFRKTDFQKQWAKMQRLTCGLMLTDASKEAPIRELFDYLENNKNKSENYLKSFVLSRMMGYFASIRNIPNAIKCAKMCIEIGESCNMLLHPTLAYGVLARAAIALEQQDNACAYTTRYLRLCAENGIYEYFGARTDYYPVLQFASIHGIEPEITKRLLQFSGFMCKKAYMKTFGGFAVYPYSSREKPVRMRTRKARELLAYLLDAGDRGVTKDEIYHAIWSESESENIKRLIGVNLAQIKKDLSALGIENPVICRQKRYSICMDEIECDFELFDHAAYKFSKEPGPNESRKLISLYTGEYLANVEAHWAIPKRLAYQNIYERALQIKKMNYGNPN